MKNKHDPNFSRPVLSSLKSRQNAKRPVFSYFCGLHALSVPRSSSSCPVHTATFHRVRKFSSISVDFLPGNLLRFCSRGLCPGPTRIRPLHSNRPVTGLPVSSRVDLQYQSAGSSVRGKELTPGRARETTPEKPNIATISTNARDAPKPKKPLHSNQIKPDQTESNQKSATPVHLLSPESPQPLRPRNAGLLPLRSASPRESGHIKPIQTKRSTLKSRD
jgi:hypothetical protein